ncbi:peptidyl-prolyl cis-trans isomerase-like 3 [Sagmatias obliquidens]|uniref:peptidyl-prolyl cis-trans isomerase-like 3 n=1 Tax=Sagmatias obliquidens TaxID=3371155 RepID=UPI000F4436CC|nr:peptidyl-prolyl cis-trans isomerase-like 3 [Lagenorhynchus obliquidens]
MDKPCPGKTTFVIMVSPLPGPPYYLKSPSIEYEINSLPHSFYENQYQSNQRFKESVTLHTDVGDIKIEVFCERTPKTCENFLALCASNYYNGCIFHRNIKGFMVQTGDPTGTGRGGSSIWGKKFEDEYSEYLKHNVRGVVSMANNGPNTNGSQFFITYGKQPHLDMKYTVFGKVIDGLETLDELEKLPVNEKTYRPLNDVHIKDITIHANPFAQ